LTDKTYENGLRDGRIVALEEIAGQHRDRLDSHSTRLRRMERIIWAGGGMIVLIQLIPELRMVLGAGP